ncbi:unnamed protein product [Urochloa humidicola]
MKIGRDQVAREEILRYKLERVEDQIDTYWRQRAHVNWLQKGDRNTAFFHAACRERRRRNKIGRLRRDDGVWIEGEDEKKDFITNYFAQLFRSNNGHTAPQLLNAVGRCVTEEMNEGLTKEFTPMEVRMALESIGDLKAPGPDGMPSIFYKKFWEMVGERVTEEVLGVLNGGPMPEGWNDTNIVLIPEVPKPVQVKDLRPISLCNVIYKLVAKVFENRLKVILPEVISPAQSAFVPGRLISDNILVAYELTHYMRNKRKGKMGYVAVKLDMSKAYDRVEWSFLEDIMLKMGFRQRWIDLIMKCVTTVRYRIKVNGELSDELVPERGLRQGDPLSPYLFLICAEGFSALLNQAEREGTMKGVKICQNAPSVSHLLFADDSLILFRAKEGDAQQLQSILTLYEECSGQMINRDKSAIMFSPNTGQEDREAVMGALNIQKQTMNERYLGMPVHVGQNRQNVFSYLKERVWARIQGWKEKTLSWAGKEVLIKAVAQAIPTFVMGCFDITKEMSDQISTTISRYWWSNQDKDNKIHWIRWEKLTWPKEEGGLGFRDIHGFNLVMLAKQGWRLIHNPNSLCARVLRAKYFPDGDVLKAKPGPNISYTWRSILKGLETLKLGIIWRVGNGEHINIWSDPWLPREWCRKPITPRGNNLLRKVSELIDPNTGKWDETMVRDTFWDQDAECILSIPTHTDLEDIVAWHYDVRGAFSVRSAYKVLRDQWRRDSRTGGASTAQGTTLEKSEWKKLWKMKCPGKVKQFLWRFTHNSLAVRRNLERRGMKVDSRCVMCGRLVEDGGHLFFKCKFVKKVWRELCLEEQRKLLADKLSAREVVTQIL